MAGAVQEQVSRAVSAFMQYLMGTSKVGAGQEQGRIRAGAKQEQGRSKSRAGAGDQL